MGRNAVIEAARFAPALEKLNDPATKTKVTVDILKGGATPTLFQPAPS